MKTCFKILSTHLTLAIFFGLFTFVAERQADPQSKVYHIIHREVATLDMKSKLEISNAVGRLASEYQIDPLLILAVIRVESHFKSNAQSNKGAIGLMQIKPIAAKEIAKQLGIKSQHEIRHLMNRNHNIRLGVQYLAFLIKKFDGDIRKALMAYNQGPTTITRLYKNCPVPLRGYQEKVIRTYHQYSKI